MYVPVCCHCGSRSAWPLYWCRNLPHPPTSGKFLSWVFKNFLIKASMVHYWLGLFVSTETRRCFILWKGDRVVSPPIGIPFQNEDNLPHVGGCCPIPNWVNRISIWRTSNSGGYHSPLPELGEIVPNATLPLITSGFTPYPKKEVRWIPTRLWNPRLREWVILCSVTSQKP